MFFYEMNQAIDSESQTQLGGNILLLLYRHNVVNPRTSELAVQSFACAYAPSINYGINRSCSDINLIAIVTQFIDT